MPLSRKNVLPATDTDTARLRVSAIKVRSMRGEFSGFHATLGPRPSSPQDGCISIRLSLSSAKSLPPHQRRTDKEGGGEASVTPPPLQSPYLC